jgi:hypothetical protein
MVLSQELILGEKKENLTDQVDDKCYFILKFMEEKPNLYLIGLYLHKYVEDIGFVFTSDLEDALKFKEKNAAEIVMDLIKNKHPKMNLILVTKDDLERGLRGLHPENESTWKKEL